MINNLTSVSEVRFDVCVIGAGAAGIITALELCRANEKVQIALLEYGPTHAITSASNSLDDSIQIQNSVNHHPPSECTNKGIGGTTASWGGRCVMYDEIDFLPREIIGDHCTWDIQLFQELQQYISKAQQYFQSGNGDFRLPASTVSIAEKFSSDDVTDTAVERWSLPTRFGDVYRAELESTPNLHLICNVEARSFDELNDEGVAKAVRTKFRDSNKELKIQAGCFVVATGAQEATRLLLRSPSLFNSAGGVPDSLGKYYQGHVSGKIASVKFTGDPKKTDFGFIREPDGTYLRRRFQLTTDCLVRENLLNTAMWLDNPLYYDPIHRSGAMSFMYLAMITPILGKKLAPPAIAHSITKGKVNKVGSHLWNIVRGLPSSLTIPAGVFLKRYCMARKLPGVFLFSPTNKYALHYHAEQVPNSNNRMSLGDDGETLVIEYELTNSDIQSVIANHKVLDTALRSSNAGYLEYWYAEEDLPNKIREISRDGLHQNGTTRIADSVANGVVDRNLRVFGTENVYVCSSSAFPTSSQANPTFFLGAFAVRLALFIKENHVATN